MPQFSPLWFINLISWSFAILSFVVWYSTAITFPSIIRLKLSRIMLCHKDSINSLNSSLLNEGLDAFRNELGGIA